MKKMNLLFFLLMLSALTACKKDVYEAESTLMSIEQFSPVVENGMVKLSAKVSLPREIDRETAHVGFLVKELTSGMNQYIDEIILEGAYWSPYDAYRNWKYGDGGSDHFADGENTYFWFENTRADGSFRASFVPQMKQYLCVAFVMNILDDTGYSDAQYQVLTSKPYFFTGEASLQLEMVSAFKHQFKLSCSSLDNNYVEGGLCWSATNSLPNLEDNPLPGYFTPNYQTNSFDFVDFGNHETVYLRGFIKIPIEGDSYSYKVAYSNVIEFHPKDQVVNIQSKEDMQKFIASMYERYTYSDGMKEYEEYVYQGYRIWDVYHGKINFGYEVEKNDWIDPLHMAEYGDTTYLELDELNATLQGRGVLPKIQRISKLGKVIGMSLSDCNVNEGVLENVTHSVIYTNYGKVEGGSHVEINDNHGVISHASYVYIYANYGEFLNSDHVLIENNYGLVEGCKEVYGERDTGYGWVDYWDKMVDYNQSEGRIINCSISEFSEGYNHLICRVNYGYMENCLPDSACCTNNHGVIQNPPTNGNAGGGIVEGE